MTFSLTETGLGARSSAMSAIANTKNRRVRAGCAARHAPPAPLSSARRFPRIGARARATPCEDMLRAARPMDAAMLRLYRRFGRAPADAPRTQ